ncbi:putative mRNA capping enzyme [Megavirus courdo11]|uniref:Putative mRNA capping enzyme n=2 Tax=Megavirus TaxID=3044761 RepID=K7YHA1_9VIRU|nr:putative mRNA enzyme [Megavirus courdo7]AFX92679.1 putative mRNA capping enzyme [Megavirus courdo11]
MNNSPTPIKNAGLGTREVKNLVLKYLYSSRVNLNLRHEYIKNEKDLDNIRDNDYIVCPRFSGTRSWILFFKSEYDIYYAVNFPKHSQKKKNILIYFPSMLLYQKIFIEEQ